MLFGSFDRGLLVFLTNILSFSVGSNGGRVKSVLLNVDNSVLLFETLFVNLSCSSFKASFLLFTSVCLSCFNLFPWSTRELFLKKKTNLSTS